MSKKDNDIRQPNRLVASPENSVISRRRKMRESMPSLAEQFGIYRPPQIEKSVTITLREPKPFQLEDAITQLRAQAGAKQDIATDSSTGPQQQSNDTPKKRKRRGPGFYGAIQI